MLANGSIPMLPSTAAPSESRLAAAGDMLSLPDDRRNLAASSSSSASPAAGAPASSSSSTSSTLKTDVPKQGQERVSSSTPPPSLPLSPTALTAVKGAEPPQSATRPREQTVGDNGTVSQSKSSSNSPRASPVHDETSAGAAVRSKPSPLPAAEPLRTPVATPTSQTDASAVCSPDAAVDRSALTTDSAHASLPGAAVSVIGKEVAAASKTDKRSPSPPPRSAAAVTVGSEKAHASASASVAFASEGENGTGAKQKEINGGGPKLAESSQNSNDNKRRTYNREEPTEDDRRGEEAGYRGDRSTGRPGRMEFDEERLSTFAAVFRNAGAERGSESEEMAVLKRGLGPVDAAHQQKGTESGGSRKRKERDRDPESPGACGLHGAGAGGARASAVVDSAPAFSAWNEAGGRASAEVDMPFSFSPEVLSDPPLGEGWDENGNDLSKIANDAIRKAQCEAWTAKLRQEAAAIRAGDHPEVVRRSVLTVEAAKRRSIICERNAIRQQNTAERLYQMEVKSIEASYEAAIEQTRERLMNEINEEIRRSKSRMEGFKEVENRMNTRHTRGNAKGSIEDPWLAQTTGSKTNGNSKRPLCPISLVLEDDALTQDIEFLRYAGQGGSNGGGRGGGGGGGSDGDGGYDAYDMSPGVSGRARRPPVWRRDD